MSDLMKVDHDEERASSTQILTDGSKRTGFFVDLKNLSIDVKLPSGEDKRILQPTTMHMEPGSMLAILGPSGSGKTTLLSALSGRLEKTMKLSGELRYDGKVARKRVMRKVGFVAQDDALRAQLTVRETLEYIAALRMNDPWEVREKRVDAVIAALGLERAAKTKIGSAMARGVSGGERKRTAIATTLLADPSVLLLDEPTSGLDSTSADRLVEVLGQLAKSGGKTVIMTIHQPSSKVYRRFDKVMLLSEGRTLFMGGSGDILPFLESAPLHIPCPALTNPADFLLDVASNPTASGAVAAEWKKRHNKDDAAGAQAITVTMEDSEEDELLNADLEQKWETGFWWQLAVLSHRSFKVGASMTMASLSVGQTIVLGIIVGLLWFQIPLNTEKVMDEIGLFFFSTVFIGFSILFESLSKFPAERVVLRRERSAGLFRLSAYYIAKFAADLPHLFVIPSLWLATMGPLSGLRLTPTAVFGTWGALLLSSAAAQSLGVCMSTWIMNFERSLVFAAVIMLSMMLAGGYYVDVPPWLEWLSSLSFISYAYPLMVHLEYYDLDIPCPDSAPFAFNSTTKVSPTRLECPATGEDVVRLTRPQFTDPWANAGMLVVFFFVFRFFAYWGLRKNA